MRSTETMNRPRDEALPEAPSKLAQEVREVAGYLWTYLPSTQDREPALRAWAQLRAEEIRRGD